MKISLQYEKRNKKSPWVVRWYGLPDIETGKRERFAESFPTKESAQEYIAHLRLNNNVIEYKQSIKLRRKLSKDRINYTYMLDYVDSEGKRQTESLGHDNEENAIIQLKAKQEELKKIYEPPGDIKGHCKNRGMTETETTVFNFLANEGFLVLRRGWPDFLIIDTHNIQAMAVEVKSIEAPFLSTDQKLMHKWLREIGIPVISVQIGGGNINSNFLDLIKLFKNRGNETTEEFMQKMENKIKLLNDKQ
jgi:hypothetical protein